MGREGMRWGEKEMEDLRNEEVKWMGRYGMSLIEVARGRER